MQSSGGSPQQRRKVPATHKELSFGKAPGVVPQASGRVPLSMLPAKLLRYIGGGCRNAELRLESVAAPCVSAHQCTQRLPPTATLAVQSARRRSSSRPMRRAGCQTACYLGAACTQRLPRWHRAWVALSTTTEKLDRMHASTWHSAALSTNAQLGQFRETSWSAPGTRQ